jgi:hypothetical protein
MDAGGVNISVSESKDGLQITLSGAGARGFNAKLIQECANALVRCAATNACLEGGLKLQAACAETLVKHNEALSCVNESFGLSGLSSGARTRG